MARYRTRLGALVTILAAVAWLPGSSPSAADVTPLGPIGSGVRLS